VPYTNRGLYRIHHAFFAAQSQPVTFYVHLIINPVPTFATNTMGELTQIANGNGYSTGGVQLSRNLTDFTSFTENDIGNLVLFKVRTIAWTASGGTIPSNGIGARAAVICDDHAAVSSRAVLAWWEFGVSSGVVVSDGQSLSLPSLYFTSYPISG
jgi:hypothetical protein